MGGELVHTPSWQLQLAVEYVLFPAASDLRVLIHLFQSEVSSQAAHESSPIRIS